MRGSRRKLSFAAIVAITAALLMLGQPQPMARERVAATGPRPGPDVLYLPAPNVPELSVTRPFRAKPLLVSGTDAYCAGEYLYQDYLFDDHGANTSASFANGGDFGIFPPAGDVDYPADPKYARNAADLVEFRVRPTKTALVYRITLNTAIVPDATAIGIGIDTDGGDEPVAWPGGAGLTSPGLDAFITAWGTGAQLHTGAELATLRGLDVAMSTGRNQMTITVPRKLLDPGTGTWRFVAGAGLHKDGGFMPVDGAPAIYNLAFRFTEKQRTDGTNTGIGNGNWFEEGQGVALADGVTGEYTADVDFAKAASSGACEFVHAPKLDQARVLGSRMDVPEGVHAGAAPNFGGRLQPYMLHLPEPGDEPPGIVLALHGNTATYTQWAAVSPNYIDQIGRQRNSVVISPLGRSTQGSGIELDFFEAWADAARHYTLDFDRAVVSGYSAGGYMTYVVGLQYPDLFGGAFAIVGAGRLLDGGAPGDHTNFIPMAGNARWVPYVAWNQMVDELAPYIGILGTQQEFSNQGLRHRTFSFPVGEHFTPGLFDQWVGAAEFLDDAPVTRDPHRVDFMIAPETWKMYSPNFGVDERFPAGHLVADHAYWVSGLRTRADVRDETNTVRGSISATSHAFGVGDAPPTDVVDVYAGPPTPATIHGTDWGETPEAEVRNALDLTLTNIGQATIWGARAKLSGKQPLEVKVTSDGAATVRIVLGSRSVTLSVPAGTKTFTIAPK